MTKQELVDMILAEKEKGNVVCMVMHGGVAAIPLKDIIRQSANGLLYDLNRLEEVVLTFVDDSKWVNDYAVAQVIRELHSRSNGPEVADWKGTLATFLADYRRYDNGDEKMDWQTLRHSLTNLIEASEALRDRLK